MRSWRHALGVVLVLALALVGGACDGQAKESSERSPEAAESTGDTKAKAAASTSETGARESTTATGGAKSSRMIIRTASLRLEVENPANTAAEIEAFVREAGGYVGRAVAGDSRASLTLRVPSGQFDGAVGRLREFGTVEHEEISGRDVTRQYRDLKAEIDNKKALEARLRSMLQGAEDLDAALKVEKELARVRTRIQKLEDRRKGMEHDVELSKIEVTLIAPHTTGAPTLGDELGEAFGDAGDNFVAVCTGLIRVAGGALPLLLLLAVGVAGLVALLRGRGAATAGSSGRDDEEASPQ